MSGIFAPISAGELIDKITILEIKKDKTSDPAKLANITEELRLLTDLCNGLQINAGDLKEQLRVINLELWDIEDFKRNCEKAQDFGPAFIQAARNVYIKNDRRAVIKREINLATNSHIVEEKIY